MAQVKCEIWLKVHPRHQIIFFSATQFEPGSKNGLSSSPIKCLRTPVVHCCLPVLFFASNNKKGWIVSFLALSSPPDVIHCCFLSLFISVSFPSVLSSIFRVSFPHPLSLSLALVSASLLFIHPLVPLSITNASRCHISLLTMCCPFICLLSLPPSCASSISLPRLSWCRILISSGLTRRDP